MAATLELFKTPLAADANIKAYYRMEAGALTTDSSGNGKTLTNVNTVADGTGVFRGAADFGAANSSKLLKILETLSYLGGVYSISFWVKLNAEIGSGNWRLVEITENTTKTSIFVQYNYNAGTRQLYFDRLKATVVDQAFTYNITLGTANWYHIAFVFNGSNLLTGYVNGASVGSVAITAGSGSGTIADALAIGANSGGAVYSSALIDDVACFNRELTAAEILSIYQGDGWAASTNYLTNYRPRKRTPGAVSV